MAKGRVLTVWATAVNSKFSVTEKAWHVNLASGLVLHEAGIPVSSLSDHCVCSPPFMLARRTCQVLSCLVSGQEGVGEKE